MTDEMNTLIASLTDDVRENLEGLLDAEEGAWLLPGGDLTYRLIRLDFVEPGPKDLGYVLTKHGEEVARALVEMRRAQRAAHGPTP